MPTVQQWRNTLTSVPLKYLSESEHPHCAFCLHDSFAMEFFASCFNVLIYFNFPFNLLLFLLFFFSLLLLFTFQWSSWITSILILGHMLFPYPLLCLCVCVPFLHIFLAVSSLQGSINLRLFCDEHIPSTGIYHIVTHTNHISGWGLFPKLRLIFLIFYGQRTDIIK